MCDMEKDGCSSSSSSLWEDDEAPRFSREDLVEEAAEVDNRENETPSSLEYKGTGGGKKKDKVEVDNGRYEQIPDTVAALQNSHKTLLAQLRETQEMLELVLEDNEKLRGQLCASQTALVGSQRMHEQKNPSNRTPCVYSNEEEGRSSGRSNSNNENDERKYSALRETTNAMSAIAKIHKQEAKSTRLQRDTLKQVLQSQDLESIVSI